MLEVKEITKYYGRQCAVDKVSFLLKKGEIVGFIGPNGAGKSTLMKIITGYLQSDEGTVYIDNLDIAEHGLTLKKRIGYLPEHNPLYLHMYVTEYLSFVAGLYSLGKSSKERVEEMIHLTGLTPERNKRIGALSKGYRQRVGIAQALIHNPDILILDEPTSGLDPNQIVEIRNLIQSVAKEKCVLLSTHIMQEVEAICHRIILISKGKIIADQPTALVGKNSHTLIIETNIPVKEHFFTSLEGVRSAMEQPANQWLIECHEGYDLREVIFNKAVSEGVKILSLQKKEKPLEEVFRELTQS
ncbi:MAG: gliding motility-associated ABC transporter ATP-binding subunit GldA [Bacteroidales bacterium]|nr:gliding motility-associated ABC transporter ATP-binding subunit GldA [Bacteroidales bacterium]